MQRKTEYNWKLLASQSHEEIRKCEVAIDT